MFADTVDDYIAKAEKKKLYETRYWKILLHYEGSKSEITKTDPFFLSKEGYHSPKKELVATIKALYEKTPPDSKSAICRYPARVRFLKKELGLQNLPKATCKNYQKVFKRLDPTSVTLVFPSAHINSPASMFGHTFLRINSSYDSKLLSYAINYAASADQTKENGLVFAIKGLFGGYSGKYSLLPYYDKLKEYREVENRDIWEYDLNLTKEESIRLLEHAWEIKDADITYYFFTNNCSYEMLWLLEAARPSAHIRDYFTYQVIPLESVEAVKEAGMIKSCSYRPSRRSKILAYESVLGYEESALVKKLAKGEIDAKELAKTTLPPKQKRYILQAAVELLQYRYQSKEVGKKRYLELFHALTSARAKLGKKDRVLPKRPPNPLDGHRAARIGAGVGTITGDKAVFVDFRPAYHDVTDSSYGFLQGTQIEFGSFELSLSQKRFRFEKAYLFRAVSITPIDRFFTPFSWNLSLGWDTDSQENKSRFLLHGGIGSSVGNDYGFAYLLTNLFIYDSKEGKFGAEVSLGASLEKWSESWNTFAEYNLRYYDNNKVQNIVRFTQTFRLRQNIACKLSYSYKQRYQEEFRRDSSENLYKVNLNYYF